MFNCGLERRGRGGGGGEHNKEGKETLFIIRRKRRGGGGDGDSVSPETAQTVAGGQERGHRR